MPTDKQCKRRNAERSWSQRRPVDVIGNAVNVMRTAPARKTRAGVLGKRKQAEIAQR